MPEERLLDRAGGILGGGTNLVPTSGGSNRPGRPNGQLSHQHVAGDRRGWLGDSKARGASRRGRSTTRCAAGPGGEAAGRDQGDWVDQIWQRQLLVVESQGEPPVGVAVAVERPAQAVRRHVVSISVEDLDREDVVAGKPPSVAEADAARRVEVWAAVVRVESPGPRARPLVPLHGQELLGPVDPEQDRLAPELGGAAGAAMEASPVSIAPAARGERDRRRTVASSETPVLDRKRRTRRKPPPQRSVRTRRPERTVDERPRRGRRPGGRAKHRQANGNSAPEEQNAAEQDPRFRPAHSGKPTRRTATRFAQQRRLPPQRHRKDGPCKRALRLFGRTPPIP